MNHFARDVVQGLSAQPKFLSSKYFYDKRGGELFKKIMELDEYYLTRSEFEILDRSKGHLLSYFASEGGKFQLIEFGAGDGLKTKILLSHFLKNGPNFKYLPIDISQNALKSLMNDLDSTYPKLNGYGINDDYFSALNSLKKFNTRKVVMFLGSNIGNFTPNQAQGFLERMRKELSDGDYVLIGFDLKKDPDLIRKAYNDSQGITREFNLNLLRRINRELGADFKLNNFQHDPSYIENTGAALSHIKSLKSQTVTLSSVDKEFSFEEDEQIFTEISQKYSIEAIEQLAKDSGFQLQENFFDSKGYFVDTLWAVN